MVVLRAAYGLATGSSAFGQNFCHGGELALGARRVQGRPGTAGRAWWKAGLAAPNGGVAVAVAVVAVGGVNQRWLQKSWPCIKVLLRTIRSLVEYPRAVAKSG